MLAKILVGVLAAVAVTGVGVYFALPDNETGGCCSKKAATEQPTLPVSEGSSCCAAHTAKLDCTAEEPAPCCAVKTVATSADALSAATGGMATAAPAKTCTKCCDE